MNIFGIDTIIYADSDADGDACWTTNHPVFQRCRTGDIPIGYEPHSANKKLVKEEDIFKGDLDGFNSKIGFITNVSSAIHCMKYDVSLTATETSEIEKRLKLLRKFQGSEIDSAKNGGVKEEIPLSWVKYDRELPSTMKNIVANKRPYFTRYLYESYDKKFRDELDKHNKFCWSHFGKSIEDIVKSDDIDLTSEELQAKRDYYKYS